MDRRGRGHPGRPSADGHAHAGAHRHTATDGHARTHGDAGTHGHADAHGDARTDADPLAAAHGDGGAHSRARADRDGGARHANGNRCTGSFPRGGHRGARGLPAWLWLLLVVLGVALLAATMAYLRSRR